MIPGSDLRKEVPLLIKVLSLVYVIKQKYCTRGANRVYNAEVDLSQVYKN